MAGRAPRTPAGTARKKILDEALQRFVTSGYRGTTIDAIARGAGVAVQSVYFVFGNKREVLKALIDINVAGDEQPVATLDREWVREVLAEPDPRRHIERQVRAAGIIYRRVAALLEVMRGASDDDEIAELWHTNQKQRRAVQRRLVAALHKKHPLPPHLTVNRATDVCYAVLGPEMYHLLVEEQGWSAPEWERWAVRTLSNELLAQTPAPV